MLWLKALHLVAMVAWFAGLFYLPRLFVYHAMTPDPEGRARFATMEHKLLRAIMTPAALATVILGAALLARDPAGYLAQGWMQIKLALVAGLIAFHVYCGRLANAFRGGRDRHGHVFYRVLNEVPTVLLVAIVILAVVKPF